MENTLSNTPANPTASLTGKTNPLVLAAAGGVLVFSLLGIAALTGIIPNAQSQKSGEEIVARTMGAGSAESAKSAQPARPRVAAAAACANCGTVESVRAVEVKGQGSGVGAVAGGITGAVVGSQMGRGNGNTAMTILGAAGGAFAGNEIEKNVKKQVSYRVTVRMDDGSYRTVSQSAPASLGDKVRVVDGNLVSRL